MTFKNDEDQEDDSISGTYLYILYAIIAEWDLILKSARLGLAHD
jgi:hypothetical protein